MCFFSCEIKNAILVITGNKKLLINGFSFGSQAKTDAKGLKI
jgi:hypothetical protein